LPLPRRTKSIRFVLSPTFTPALSSLLLPSKTTVSRFFTDKSGAVPLNLEEITDQVPRRPSLLQRLHITNSARKKSPSPGRRPQTGHSTFSFSSSSHASRSSSKSRPASPNALPPIDSIDQLSLAMPQSLMLNTPPPLAPFKRQRSRGGEEQSRPGSASGQARSATGFDANGAYEPRPTVRMPSYLNKNKSGKYGSGHVCKLDP